MNAPQWSDLLYARLNRGRDGAQTYGELAESMGAPRRELENVVQTLRLEGKGIVTGSAGIWLSEDADELEAAAARLEWRALHQLEGAKALRATARRYRVPVYVQPSLFDSGEAA